MTPTPGERSYKRITPKKGVLIFCSCIPGCRAPTAESVENLAVWYLPFYFSPATSIWSAMNPFLAIITANSGVSCWSWPSC